MDRPVKRVVSAEIVRDGRWLLTQRSASAAMPLLWEFPGGRVREGESEEEALIRSVRSRIGVTVRPVERLLEVRHSYHDYVVYLSVWSCEVEGDQEPLASPTIAAVAWALPDEFGDYVFPDADLKTIEQLLSDG
jgi:8-oxo-dGTP diphosphatase